jgi:hypothetical protein
MKNRICAVTADDGDLTIEIKITVTPRKGHPLEEDELDAFEKKMLRRIAAVLPELPFVDFGIENTRVETGLKL